jgi:hypothetical protein
MAMSDRNLLRDGLNRVTPDCLYLGLDGILPSLADV